VTGSRGRSAWTDPMSPDHGVCRYGDYFGRARPVGSDTRMVRRGIRPRGRVGWGTFVLRSRSRPMLTLSYRSIRIHAGLRPAVHFVRDGTREFRLDRAATTTFLVTRGRPGTSIRISRSSTEPIPRACAGGCESTRGRKTVRFGVPDISRASGHNRSGIGRISILTRSTGRRGR